MTILPRHLDACEVTSLGNWLIQFGVAAAIVNLETRADYGVNSRYYMMSQPFSAHFIFYYLFIYLLNWSPVVFSPPSPSSPCSPFALTLSQQPISSLHWRLCTANNTDKTIGFMLMISWGGNLYIVLCKREVYSILLAQLL